MTTEEENVCRKGTFDTMTDIDIIDYRCVAHISLKCAHLSKYSGMFDCPGKPLHGRRLFHESETEMDEGEPGRTTSMFYLSDEAKTFKTLKSLVKHYNKEGK